VVSTTALAAHAARFSDQPLDELFAKWVHGTRLPPLPKPVAPTRLPAMPTYPPTNAEPA
jgi:hypothetical protein